MRFFSVFGCVISFSANAMDYSGPRECAKNAAYLAIQILALKYDDLASKLKKYKAKLER